MERKEMSLEAVICQALDHARTSGWDARRQTELAARVVQRVRPEWSELEAVAAVDWVRSGAAYELRPF